MSSSSRVFSWGQYAFTIVNSRGPSYHHPSPVNPEFSQAKKVDNMHLFTSKRPCYPSPLWSSGSVGYVFRYWGCWKDTTLFTFCNSDTGPPKQFTNKSSWFRNCIQRNLWIPWKDQAESNSHQNRWKGELIDSFQLQPQTRGNARNSPEKTNTVVPLLAGITILTNVNFCLARQIILWNFVSRSTTSFPCPC